MKKTILFLMSDTGGGHRASAQAIEEAIQHLHPNQYTIIIEDMWKKHTPWPFNRLPDLYGWFTGPGLPLWRLMWRASAYASVQSRLFTFIFPVIKQRGADYIKQIQPDLIVSVHPVMNQAGMGWLTAAGLNVPFVTIVTDMVTFHPSWICFKGGQVKKERKELDKNEKSDTITPEKSPNNPKELPCRTNYTNK